MVCPRCILVVQQVMDKHKLKVKQVSLGEVELEEQVDENTAEALKKDLQAEGFELLDSKAARLIASVKSEIIQLVHHSEKFELPQKLSVLLEEKTKKDYAYLSSLFSETEGVTIEKYLMAQRIEKAKELLAYGELNLNQIAEVLGYSSAAHFSNQFKQLNGMTPSAFKKVADDLRKPLDQI